MISKDEIASDLKRATVTIVNKLCSFGFWLCLAFAGGLYIGIGYAKMEINNRVEEAVALGNFLQKTTVSGKVVTRIYDVKERIQ